MLYAIICQWTPLAVMSSAAMNTAGLTALWACFQFSWVRPGVEVLGHVGALRLTL